MLPTITIQSTRLVTPFVMELLLSSVVVIAVVGWMMMTHARHHRHR